MVSVFTMFLSVLGALLAIFAGLALMVYVGVSLYVRRAHNRAAESGDPVEPWMTAPWWTWWYPTLERVRNQRTFTALRAARDAYRHENEARLAEETRLAEEAALRAAADPNADPATAPVRRQRRSWFWPVLGSVTVLFLCVCVLSMFLQTVNGGLNAAAVAPVLPLSTETAQPTQNVNAMPTSTLGASTNPLATATTVAPADPTATTVAPTLDPTATAVQEEAPLPEVAHIQAQTVDMLFENGEFPGVLPSAAYAKVTTELAEPGLSCQTETGNDVGPWNQPTNVDDYDKWCDALAWQTAYSIKPGESVTVTMKYESFLFKPDGDEEGKPYSTWWNMFTVYANNQVLPGAIPQGISLTAPDGLMLRVKYGEGDVCEAQSVDIVPDIEITVTMSCPADNNGDCIVSQGQWGELIDMKTGQILQGEYNGVNIQNLGGNVVEPGCKDPNFPGVFEWLQSMKS